MPDDLQEQKLQEIATKVFGSLPGGIRREGVPRTLLQILAAKVTFQRADVAQIAGVLADYDKPEFGVIWLDGHLLCGITYRGKESDVSADEFAYPLASVTAVRFAYNFTYDEWARRHTWTRTATIELRDREQIVLENVPELQSSEKDTNRSKFVSALVQALAKWK